MRTSGIITDSAWRSFNEFHVERKKRAASAQTIKVAKRAVYFVLVTPAFFFAAIYFGFRISLAASLVIALLWFLSFVIGGYLFFRGAVSAATRRPNSRSFREPRDYTIEDGWLVERAADAEKRVALRRALELTIKPTASFLDFGELGIMNLPFGSASESEGQREFLEALKSQLPKHGTA